MTLMGIVLGWKFAVPGISTQQVEDGSFVITEWPESLGERPTPEQLATWTAEYEVAKAIPAKVTRTQALLALLAAGITEAAIAEKIAAIIDDTTRERARIRFNGAEWERDSDLLAAMATAFGLSKEQVDALFVTAAGL